MKYQPKTAFRAEDGPRKGRGGRRGWSVYNAWDHWGKRKQVRMEKKYKGESHES